MLSFAVFEHGGTGGSGAVGDWPLRHAHLFGADDIPIQSEIVVEGGVIRCEKRSQESAGISLQFPVASTEGAGPPVSMLTLQTCLLPERSRPYLLSLELARHRLMLILNKLEDWALFDLPADEPGMVVFERARRAFTDAVVMQGGNGETLAPFTAEADRLARRALALGIEAGETLTLRNAEIQYGKRMRGELAAAASKIATPANALTEHEAAESRNALIGNVGVILPTPPQVGCMVNPEHFTPALTKAAAACSDFLCMPMRWVDMEPTEGKYVFAKADRWIEWAVRTARVPIVGGPIVDFRRGSVPEWLYIWEHDYETLRELVYEHVKNVVTRYRRTIGTWTVCSGLHVNANFSFSLEQVMDLTRLVVMVVRKLQPSAKVQVQIDQPWGEYYALGPRAIPPVMYAEMIGQAGVNPDLLALRIEMGQPEPGGSVRDMMAFSALLDRFAALDKPLAIGAISAPSRPPAPENLGTERQLDPGYWRREWSRQTQVGWMTQALSIAASKPYVHSICWDELYELGRVADPNDHGLIDAEGQAKPSLFRLAEIRKAIAAKQPPLRLPESPAAFPL